MKPAPSLPALFLWTIKKMPPQPASFGRAASGGALAPQPLRSTRNTPEFTEFVQKHTFFSFFFWVQPGLKPNVKNAGRAGSPQKWPKKRPKPILVWKSAVGKKLGSASWTQISWKLGFSRLNPKYVEKIELSRLNSNFLKTCWDEPAQLDLDAKIRVEPAPRAQRRRRAPLAISQSPYGQFPQNYFSPHFFELSLSCHQAL